MGHSLYLFTTRVESGFIDLYHGPREEGSHRKRAAEAVHVALPQTRLGPKGPLARLTRQSRGRGSGTRQASSSISRRGPLSLRPPRGHGLYGVVCASDSAPAADDQTGGAGGRGCRAAWAPPFRPRARGSQTFASAIPSAVATRRD